MARYLRRGYLSPTSGFTGQNIERDDLINYRRTQEASENLRRAMMRYYSKRNGDGS